MIVSEIFYGIKCNRCGEIHDDGEHSYWSDESSAEEEVMESDWIKDKGKHYCIKCWEYNEEKDENVPKLAFPEYIRKIRLFIDKTLKSYQSEIIENDNHFKLVIGLYEGTSFKSFEEVYIKALLVDKFISLEYLKHERYTRYDCIILIRK